MWIIFKLYKETFCGILINPFISNELGEYLLQRVHTLATRVLYCAYKLHDLHSTKPCLKPPY